MTLSSSSARIENGIAVRVLVDRVVKDNGKIKNISVLGACDGEVVMVMVRLLDRVLWCEVLGLVRL